MEWWGNSFEFSQLWTPAQILTSLWLDAADASTITTVSGAVSQWNDKSGAQRNILQNNPASRPAYQAAGLGLNPVVTFDGINDNLGAVSLPNNSNDLNLFAVFNAAAMGIYKNVYDSLNSTPMLWINGSNALEVNTASGLVSTSSVTGAFRIFGIRTRISGLEIWINGGLDTSNNKVTPTWSNPYTLTLFHRAQAECFQGSVAEMLFVDGLVPTETRQRIEGYLAHKWGLTASLPNGHPYKSAPPYV